MKIATDTPQDVAPIRPKNKHLRQSLLLVAIVGIMTLGFSSWLMGTTINYFDAQNGTKRIDGLTPLLLMVFLVLAFGAGLIWNLKFWNTIDEAARRAHLDAFYWGGPISWMLLTPLVVLPNKINGFTLPVIEDLDFNASQVFGLGIGITILTTLIGYGIGWLFWWAKKR